MRRSLYLQKVLGTDEEQLKDYSPVFHADKIKANVMLILGSKDRRVPEINSEVLAEKLSKAGNEPFYLQYAQAGHGMYDESDKKEMHQDLINFLDTNFE
uniref:alpha/beta hydrolase family protein n=1 Tax=Ningiella ruwaisensis TaxID=2364274 RepID=UPI001F4FEF6B|nr:prolyl oligopeptidase family serine peptidase [Ningiella ruwaisensis]